MYACIHMYMYICIHIYTHTCIHTCVQIYTQMPGVDSALTRSFSIVSGMHVCTYTYICTSKHTHTPAWPRLPRWSGASRSSRAPLRDAPPSPCRSITRICRHTVKKIVCVRLRDVIVRYSKLVKPWQNMRALHKYIHTHVLGFMYIRNTHTHTNIVYLSRHTQTWTSAYLLESAHTSISPPRCSRTCLEVSCLQEQGRRRACLGGGCRRPRTIRRRLLFVSKSCVCVCVCVCVCACTYV